MAGSGNDGESGLVSAPGLQWWIAIASSAGSRRSRTPPRRAHDIFARSESVIMIYYTLKKCIPRPAGRTNGKGVLWQETTGLTVPAQET